MDHKYKVDTVIHMYFCINGSKEYTEYEVPLGELVDMRQPEIDTTSEEDMKHIIDLERQEWLAGIVDSGWKIKE